jgi:hypothetical protein
VDDVFPPHNRSPPFPKIDFPKFDGENPYLWRDNCEMFFEMYDVHPSLKTRFVALNFKDLVAAWLQMVQCKGKITDWGQLCELMMGGLIRISTNCS